jgi:hypothetical protein
MAGKKGRSGGQNKINVTSEMRAQVLAMVGFGIPQEQIAVVMHISPRSLQNRFKPELAEGGIKANSKIIEGLYNQAMKGNISALIFWAKCKCGWREVNVHEHQGPGGAPIPIAPILPPISFAGWTPEQIDRFIEATKV